MSHDAAKSARRLLILPPAPDDMTGPVKAWRLPVSILTYEPEKPNRNPMFLEKRVYQGSSGRVYPLPFIDRIATEPTDRMWDAIHIENEYIRLMVLPEIGGRIHVGFDKINGYDFFYRQNVIKPALVGLAGPWISGGVEFNWPQHHRPATFMPVETAIESSDDGAMTIWCSDHDPMLHMKGMHGVCLRPGRSAVELKVRLYNRTQFTQTFLWWANVAVRVHERYQSFFPPDVQFVADHARRAITTFPLSERPYYGVDYPKRARAGVPESETPSQFVPDGSYAPNDLSWYANIPVPTSYMTVGTEGDFLGGYDHIVGAGVVHVANRHIAPGKKQWTWGNHEFGYAWDHNLTDADGPYCELMAGAYTDNQPDFSWLAPWETKTFSQLWYPLRGTGVPQAANDEASLHLTVAGGCAELAIGVNRDHPDCAIELLNSGKLLAEWIQPMLVATTFSRRVSLPTGVRPSDISVVVRQKGKILISYDPATVHQVHAPLVAQEPLAPEMISTNEELFLAGLHLEQYRHATRQPEIYWLEAIRRDPGDSRSLIAMGKWHLRRGEVAQAVERFRAAVDRLTQLNPNPYDGESHYYLGVALRFMGDETNAYAAFYKATWNAAWRSPAYFALAEIDANRGEWQKAKDHLRRTLLAEGEHLNARNLLAFVMQKLGDDARAEGLRSETLQLDPLDIGARWLRGICPKNGQDTLDLVFDLRRAGRDEEARDALQRANLRSVDGSAPMILLVLADMESELADSKAGQLLDSADAIPSDYCFPHRIEELLVLERTILRCPDNALASYLLGNLLFDRRRHDEAIAVWERAGTLKPQFPTVWRNLGIAYFNVQKSPQAAMEAFEKAFAADPTDARVLYERDQLWKRTGRTPEERLATLLRYPQLVQSRDDLSVEVATLYNQLNRPAEALALLRDRRFQPWEGGEGLVLGQYVRACLMLGRSFLQRNQPLDALQSFQEAVHPPVNLAEAKHLLANQRDVYYWAGRTFEMLGDLAQARKSYIEAARQQSDFQQMRVRDVSTMTYWTGLALERLGRSDEGRERFRRILDFAAELEQSTPEIDYFATSLPSLLLFDDDLQGRNRIDARFLRAQAFSGLGEMDTAEELLKEILEHDPNHADAQDLLMLLQATSQWLTTN